MPIRINLLAEQQLAEEMRRRDPVKHGVWLGGFAVALVLIWSLGLWLKMLAAESEAKALDTRWRVMETTNSTVMTNLAKIRDIDAKLDSLTTLATNRIVWASMLNALQFSMVEHIQATQVRTRQSYDVTPEVKTKGTVKGKPATSTEKISLLIEARDFGPPSGEQVDHFKRKLLEQPYFKACFTNENALRLTSRSQPQPDPTDTTRTFVLFTLEGNFPEVTR